MPVNRLKQYLDSFGIRYMVISHSMAYTAQGIAALAHVSGKELAKSVIVKMDGRFAMAVVPASYHVNLVQLREAVHANSVELASEQEFKAMFPDCETGAMPPFGNLYDMPVFADASLTHDKEIAFNAGSHRELVRLSWEDYCRLVEPVVLSFTAAGKAQTVA